MSEMNTALVMLIVALLAVMATSLYHDLKRKNEQIAQIDERLKKLEAANKKRLPYRSQDEILDAMAALDALFHEFKFGTDLIENARAHLTKSMQVGTKREEDEC